MKKINDWEKIEESQDFKKLVAGGYVMKITAVEDVAQKEYLRIEYDIAEGEFAGNYKETYDRWGNWYGVMYRSYKETAAGMFKHFTNTIERCNNGYIWDWDETKLVGKYFGAVLGEEEYINQMGEIKTSLKVQKLKSIEDIRSGNYEIPAIKRVEGGAVDSQPSFASAADLDDAPF